MDWLDLFIILFLLAALVRGAEVGFVRQFFSTLGFFAGLFLGAWVNSLVGNVVRTPDARALLSLLLVLGFALGVMLVGELIGLRIKFRLRDARVTNKLDHFFGSVLAIATLLAAVWLGASIFRNIPDSGWQRQIRNSRIVTLLDNNLPSAPAVLTQLGHLIDPNGPPQVFAGLEPAFKTDAPLPDMGDLNPAVEKARASVVKIEGEGCDSEVEGSGFVAGNDEVVTNAHVVAGVRSPFVIDQKGKHGAKVVLFDPDLDIAILKTSNLAGQPLALIASPAANGTATAILGYPSNAGFTAKPGVVLESFEAEGRNIYNQGHTVRDIYSVKTEIEHGNSGGPMIRKDGGVVGVVFAKSVNYDQVGYALAMQKVIDEVNQAAGQSTRVSTESCTD